MEACPGLLKPFESPHALTPTLGLTAATTAAENTVYELDCKVFKKSYLKLGMTFQFFDEHLRCSSTLVICISKRGALLEVYLADEYTIEGENLVEH